MAQYNYRGRDEKGKLVEGMRKAVDEMELAERLMSENITPVEITLTTQSAQAKWKGQFLARFQKVPGDELQMFCRQMYTLSKAGIPIIMGIQRLLESTKNEYFADILREVITLLNEGRPLAQGLARFPKVFSELFVNIVKVGESTGRLEEAFLQLSGYLQLEEDTKKRIKASMRYPIIVVASTLIALLVINAFVIPTFAALFAKAEGQLPLMTQILMTTSGLVTGYWPYMLLSIVGAIIAFKSYVKTKKGRYNWHRISLRVPLIGWIIHRIMLARFARLFSLILSSGISAFEGLEMMSTSLGNAYLEDKVTQISDNVARGMTIAKASALSGIFSSLVVQILTVGEETGQIETMLLDVAEFYEREVEYDISRLSDALEPILLSIMAAMVLVLALGVFLPMWDMMKVAR